MFRRDLLAPPGGLGTRGSDERGEWIEITNVGRVAADLRGWSLRSANDAGFVVRQSLVVPPDSAVT